MYCAFTAPFSHRSAGFLGAGAAHRLLPNRGAAVTPKKRHCVPPHHLTVSMTVVQVNAPDRAAPGYELVRPSAPLATDGPLSQAQIDQFFEKGVIVVPRLIAGDLLAEVQEERKHLEHTLDSFSSEYEALGFALHQRSSVFLKLATDSPIVRAVAQLTPRESGCRLGREMVVVKDVLFKLKGDQQGCNFHVDNQTWPTPQGEPGPGVNVWLALDKVDGDGGGLAFAPGSHTAGYLSCREAIKESTCTIHKVAPEESKRLEAIKVVPQMEVGDVILMTRFAFHRADPFVPGSDGARGPGVMRYSVRYMPGTAWVHDYKFQKSEDGPNLKWLEPCQLMNGNPTQYPAATLR